MRKLITAAAFAVALLGGAASAATIDTFFGNTVEVTGPDGAVTNYYFDADGKMSAARGDQTMHGTWAIQGEELCLTPDGGEAACYPLEDHAVGDSWSLAGPDGTASLTLRAGR